MKNIKQYIIDEFNSRLKHTVKTMYNSDIFYVESKELLLKQKISTIKDIPFKHNFTIDEIQNYLFVLKKEEKKIIFKYYGFIKEFEFKFNKEFSYFNNILYEYIVSKYDFLKKEYKTADLFDTIFRDVDFDIEDNTTITKIRL